MYDIIIIGAGTAGIAAYKEAIKFTNNILIINDGEWDTTCARVGCMPSKVLIAAANRMHDINTADLVGLSVNTTIDTSAVMNHVRSLRDRFTKATLKDVNSWDENHKISGKASFINSNTVQVNQKNYQAKTFILAVGSTPNINQDWKDELVELFITSDQVFELAKLPKRLAVLGSGVIAIELAQAMQRLGVETTVFARSKKVGSISSPELQKLAQEIINQELDIKYKVLPDQLKRIGNEVVIQFTENDEVKEIQVDYVLNATGRTSLLNTLNLEKIDTQFNDLKNLPVNAESKQLGDYPIFIVGDAYSSTPIQHEAAHEGRKATHNCLNFPEVSPIKTLVPLGIMFSSPEMAGVGKNFQWLTEHNIKFTIGFASYEKQGRAIVNGKNKGAIEVYVDSRNRKLLGAELLATGAEHLAHLLAWVIAQQLTIDEILDNPFYHPTIEEGLRTALKHARRQLAK